MKAFIFLAMALAAVVLQGCDRAGRDSGQSKTPSDGRRSYVVRGIVRGEMGDQGSLVIEHENIPGFMPSMTMPFDYKDPREVAALKPGDGVEFNFVLTDNDSWMEKVRKIDPATVKLGGKPTKPGSSSAARLKEGDPMPEFQLVDQDGRAVTRESFAGKTLVFTFIFTRCPVPNFCPRMSQNFSELKRELDLEEATRLGVELLSISFDPEYDTPAVLKQYAETYASKAGGWRFATGTPQEIQKLTHAFSVYIRQENGTLSHGLCTVLVSPDGVIRKIWRGNAWEVAEVLTALRDRTAAQ
jgi:protein SCO1/2